jgi:hypothetical protein
MSESYPLITPSASKKPNCIGYGGVRSCPPKSEHHSHSHSHGNNNKQLFYQHLETDDEVRFDTYDPNELPVRKRKLSFKKLCCASTGAFIVCGFLFFGLVFGCIRPLERFQQTQCTFAKTEESNLTCCRKTECKPLEAGSLAPKCEEGVKSSYPAQASIFCGDGPLCLNWGNSYHSCVNPRTGQTDVCDDGYKCLQKLSNRMCSLVCESCSFLSTTFHYVPLGSDGAVNVNSNVDNVITQQCTHANNEQCVNSWKQKHQEDHQSACWVTKDNNEIQFSNPNCTFPAAAIIAAIFFAFCSLASAIALLFVFSARYCCKRI